MALSTQHIKDVTYYARKIIELDQTKHNKLTTTDDPTLIASKNKHIKDVLYYTEKIATLYRSKDSYTQQISTLSDTLNKVTISDQSVPLTRKNLTYYVNKIAKLQEVEESSSEAVKRYALFPILDEKGYEFYQKQEITHWSESELDFVADRKWYDPASPQVRKLFDTILAF